MDRPTHLQGKLYEDFKDTERFTIIYNYKCTAACAHCASESTPRAIGKVDLKEAMQYIDMAAARGYKWFCLTGGEALIYWRECLELLRYGKSLGLIMVIESNCYWGKTQEKAEKRLDELIDAGLAHLPVSADAFHIPYVPLEYVINVAQAAERRNLSYVVFFIYSGDTSKDGEILERLNRAGVYYEADECAPLGFANALAPHLFRHIDVTKIADCGELGPLILPNGDVIGCCNPKVPKVSPLYLGNINEEPLEVLLNRFHASPYVAAIRDSGFHCFHARMKENSAVLSKFGSKPYRHICEFCEDLFSDPDASAFMQSLVEGSSEHTLSTVGHRMAHDTELTKPRRSLPVLQTGQSL